MHHRTWNVIRLSDKIASQASDRRKAYEETLTQEEKLKRTVEDPSAEIQVNLASNLTNLFNN